MAAMREDYHASASIDTEHDDADLAASKRTDRPTLTLWRTRDAPPHLHGNVHDAPHFLTEDRPHETAAALLTFLRPR